MQRTGGRRHRWSRRAEVRSPLAGWNGTRGLPHPGLSGAGRRARRPAPDRPGWGNIGASRTMHGGNGVITKSTVADPTIAKGTALNKIPFIPIGCCVAILASSARMTEYGSRRQPNASGLPILPRILVTNDYNTTFRHRADSQIQPDPTRGTNRRQAAPGSGRAGRRSRR